MLSTHDCGQDCGNVLFSISILGGFLIQQSMSRPQGAGEALCSLLEASAWLCCVQAPRLQPSRGEIVGLLTG